MCVLIFLCVCASLWHLATLLGLWGLSILLNISHGVHVSAWCLQIWVYFLLSIAVMCNTSIQLAVHPLTSTTHQWEHSSVLVTSSPTHVPSAQGLVLSPHSGQDPLVSSAPLLVLLTTQSNSHRQQVLHSIQYQHYVVTSLLWWPASVEHATPLSSPYLLLNISMVPMSHAEMAYLVLLLAMIHWTYNWHVSLCVHTNIVAYSIIVVGVSILHMLQHATTVHIQTHSGCNNAELVGGDWCVLNQFAKCRAV